MEIRSILTRTAAALIATLIIPALPVQAAARMGPPHISAADAGATISAVTIETYGVVKPSGVRPYLSLHRGDRLDQAGVDRDYRNLTRLGGYIPRLEVHETGSPHAVELHWIVMAKWLEPTKHPFYGDQPLSAPIEGVGWILTSPQLGERDSNVSAYTQLSQRADLARVLYTTPASVDAAHGRQSKIIVDDFGARGDLRISHPQAINVYSWTSGLEAVYLTQWTSGTQVEFGARRQHTSTSLSSGVISPYVYPTSVAPAVNTIVEAGIDHACTVPPTHWHPPFCAIQYRIQGYDAIGGMGSTNKYESLLADVAGYVKVDSSTLALHASASRTGGVVPDSFLVCAAGLRAYPKSFCGTDGQVLMAELRLNDDHDQPIKFVLFTETGASRVRGSEVAYAPSTYTWHPDSGVGLIFHGVRFDVGYGQAGGRFTFGLVGQLF